MFDFMLVAKLADKVAELVTARDARKEKTFDLAVRHLYDDLQIIHKDYLIAYETLKSSVHDHADMRQIAKEFGASRVQLEAFRRGVAGLAAALKKDDKFSRYRPFLRAVTDYFDAGVGHGTEYTVLTEFLEYAATTANWADWYLEDDQKTKQAGPLTVARDLDGTPRPSTRIEGFERILALRLQRLRFRWQTVVEEHANAIIDAA